jgi:hypothetical protein
MKNLFLIFAFLVSTTSFSQANSTIKGNILDLDDNNAPLEMARILVNETGDKTVSDKNGDFVFNQLNPGTYTLSISFVGYETKKMEVKVLANRTTQIKDTLGSSTLSLEDLMLTLASSETTETSAYIASR